MNNVPDSLISKLKKLMNLQISAEKIGNAHEAANAAARIQDLLLKHNLSLDNLNLNKDENKIVENEVSAQTLFKKNEGEWMWMLLTGVAKGHLCKPIILSSWVNHVNDKGKRTRSQVKDGVMIIGKKENVEITLYLFDQLQVRIRDMAKASWKNYETYVLGYEKKNTYTRGFLQGCAQAIKERLIDEIIKHSQPINSIRPEYGLIKRNDTDLTEYVKNHQRFGSGLNTTNLGSTLKGNTGMEDGKQAGSKLGIHKGISSNQFGQRLIN